MARVLIYTSPARGHLYPIVGTALELHRRGHEVHMVTLSNEIDRLSGLCLRAHPMAREVEAREMNDYEGRNPIESLKLSLATFADRAPNDHVDLAESISEHEPDVLVVDNNSWGALTAAEASGLPWCSFQPYFTPLPSRDVPPFGPGLPLAEGPLGRLRDSILRPVVANQLGKNTLPVVNGLRREAGLDRVEDIVGFLTRPPLVLYFTAEPFEYPRADWPVSFEMVGPATWAPPQEAPEWLDAIDAPIVLVTSSSERQDDRVILETALAGLSSEDVFVVGTSPADDPTSFTVPANARVERFLPHDSILDRASAVVCHGGMGITQRALSKGVPVCVIPFGRDQLEVARRVESSAAGVRLSSGKLSPERLREAVALTRSRSAGAARLADAFAAAGGDERAADLVTDLYQSWRGSGRTVSAG